MSFVEGVEGYYFRSEIMDNYTEDRRQFEYLERLLIAAFLTKHGPCALQQELIDGLTMESWVIPIEGPEAEKWLKKLGSLPKAHKRQLQEDARAYSFIAPSIDPKEAVVRINGDIPRIVCR
ncbi:hypothetical protein [Leptolyngbya sp. KIOST-1]|uniref:hypothetical protein n=1 Tax=Leptolyngbya sp. KIOST-1 TaxID=1229172 RepID=UPI0012E02A7B|nr:hypothetical protein [Leptolyngbya sp. KIOST-1]